MKITDYEVSQYNVKAAPDSLKAEGDVTPRDVKHIFDRLPELIVEKFNSFVDYIANSFYTKEETEAAISKRVNDIGSADMCRAIYDTDNDGIVDNAAMLGGNLPSYYAVKADVKMKIYNSLSDIGMTTSDTFADIVAAVPNHSTIFLNGAGLTDASWNLPVTYGYVQITRRYSFEVFIVMYGRTGNAYYATTSTDGVPTGTWNKVIEQNDIDEALADYMPKAGGAFTGEVTAIGTNRTGYVVRNCGVVSSDGSALVSTNRLRFVRK